MDVLRSFFTKMIKLSFAHSVSSASLLRGRLRICLKSQESHLRKMHVRLKNELMHAICTFEAQRTNCPNLGRKRKLATAEILDRILFLCRTGCQWSQLPVAGASYKTVYHYFAIWSKARLFENVFYRCAHMVTKNDEGALIIDTSFVKNVHGFDVLGRTPTDRGRKASKISLLTNCKGTPLCAVLHKANKNDSLTLKHTLETFQRKVKHNVGRTFSRQRLRRLVLS